MDPFRGRGTVRSDDELAETLHNAIDAGTVGFPTHEAALGVDTANIDVSVRFLRCERLAQHVDVDLLKSSIVETETSVGRSRSAGPVENELTVSGLIAHKVLT